MRCYIRGMRLQLCGDGSNVFIFVGEAMVDLLAGRWLAGQRLVAPNSLFEMAFLQHHADFKPRFNVECTMLASGLLYGPLAAAEILKAVMIEAFEQTFPGAPTRGVVEIGVGYNWRDAKA